MKFTLALLGAASFLASPPLIDNATAAMSAPVRVVESDTIALDNGIVSLGVSKAKPEVAWIQVRVDGKALAIGGPKAAMYYDANGGARNPPAGAKIPRAGYHAPSPVKVVLAKHTDEMAEVVATEAPSAIFPFRTEVHYVLRRGESGFYGFVVVSHDASMPAASIGQCRFVVRGAPGTTLFTDHIADDARKGAFPTARIVKELQDATWELADGTVYTKYNNTIFEADHHLHGLAGHSIGAWMITPSNEYMNGGPVKQELSVHTENIMIATFESGHFGSSAIELGDGEKWTKCFGPCFVYFNSGASTDLMFANAKRKAQEEMAKWPYRWVSQPEYPIERGTVGGKLQLTDGSSPEGAWIVLAAPGAPWPMQAKSYEFWTRTDATGHFTLPKVRPGNYTLYASGADQFEDMHRDGVSVQPGRQTDVGLLKWEPVKHGQRLWQIGRADHSSAEFKNGDDFRHWGMFLRYAKDFPNDVTFTIGQSRERTDWNFAHWTWFSKKPVWTIRFNVNASVAGKATLTVGAAAANPIGRPPTSHDGPSGEKATNIQVKVNGTQVGVLNFVKSGAAAYRSGNQDSMYQMKLVGFDAALLKPGMNEITLGHAEAKPIPPLDEQKLGRVGCVMYDAIRLEVAPH